MSADSPEQINLQSDALPLFSNVDLNPLGYALLHDIFDGNILASQLRHPAMNGTKSSRTDKFSFFVNVVKPIR